MGLQKGAARQEGNEPAPGGTKLAPRKVRRQAAATAVQQGGTEVTVPRRIAAGADQSALSSICASWALPTAPIWVACTWPSLNSSRVGIERTWYFIATWRFWSMSTFTTLARPAYVPASSSSAGAI